MSYCRFSSHNWQCDLYAYESTEGWTTHVASSRYARPVPELPSLIDSNDNAEWLAAYQRQQEYLDQCEWVAIGLPHDGQTFVDETYADFVGRVEQLVALGYRVPPGFVDELKRELSEEE